MMALPVLPAKATRGLRARRRLRLRGSRRAVTDVPLELLIIVIILAIVVPIIIAALLTYTSEQARLTVEEQADSIRDVAVQAYDDGPNTTLLVTVTVPGNGEVTAGGALYSRLAGGLNYQGAYITYSTSTTGPTTCGGIAYCVLVTNGATDVILSNVTCSGWPVVVASSFQPFYLSGATDQLALTKIDPGAADTLCNGRVTPPANLTVPFIEVQPIP